MNERRLLCSQDEVRALQEGRMTLVIRPVKPQPNIMRWCSVQLNRYDGWEDEHGRAYPCPFGAPGTRLWVAETLAAHDDQNYSLSYAYYTDGKMVSPQKTWDKRSDHLIPSTQMPRWACRMVLENMGVSVKRAQDIGPREIIYSGFDATNFIDPDWQESPNELFGWGLDEPENKIPITNEFRRLWQSRFGKKASWDANPWAWIGEVRRVD